MQTATELPKVFGPFNGKNRRGLPIVMKNGFPAWAYVPPQTRSEARDERG